MHASTVPLLARWMGYPNPGALPTPCNKRHSRIRDDDTTPSVIDIEKIKARLNPAAAALFELKMSTVRPDIMAKHIKHLQIKLDRLDQIESTFTTQMIAQMFYTGTRSKSSAQAFIAACIKDRLVKQLGKIRFGGALYGRETE